MAALHHAKHTSILLVALIVCLILPAMPRYPAASELTTVTFLKMAEVEKDTILLGNIAEIRGSNEDFLEKLRTTVIGKSPLPGQSCRIKGEYVKIRLKQNGIELSRIVFPETRTVEISRSFVEVPPEKIESILLDFVYAHAPWDRDKMQVTNIRSTEKVILPKGQVTFKIAPLKHDDFLGTVILPILFKVDGDLQKKVWASADVALFDEVVVTKKPIGRYQLITEDDIQLQKADLAQVSSTIVTNREEVLGKRAKRAIDANVVLNANLIELPPLVKRGDIVRIIAQSDALTITAIGEIKQKGHRGENVKVENLASRREIYARVLDAHSVTVEF